MTENTAIPAPNTVAWFQIGTEDAAAAKEFYGGLFGWSFAPTRARVRATTSSATPAQGSRPAESCTPREARRTTRRSWCSSRTSPPCAAAPNSSAARCSNPPTKTPNGLVFADLLDDSGNRFGVFTPPQA